MSHTVTPAAIPIKKTALLEGAEAIKRAALQINDPQFMRLYYDLTSFHNNLHREGFG